MPLSCSLPQIYDAGIARQAKEAKLHFGIMEDVIRSFSLSTPSPIYSHPSYVTTTSGIEMSARSLVTGSSRLSDDTLELIDLRLSTAECTELYKYVSSRDFRNIVGKDGDIPASSRAYGHACPCCCGGVR
jgi:hypothetical protein